MLFLIANCHKKDNGKKKFNLEITFTFKDKSKKKKAFLVHSKFYGIENVINEIKFKIYFKQNIKKQCILVSLFFNKIPEYNPLIKQTCFPSHSYVKNEVK